MTHSAAEPHAAHDHDHHGPKGVGIYVAVAIALVFLTACSYATYTPVWETLIGDSVAVKRIWMMAVSCTKAMLVIMFFMHLKWEANWKWVLTIPASLMSLFLVLMLVPDVGLRMNKASYERLKYSAETPAVEPDRDGLKVHKDDH
ncbi:MAG: cytochrome C oxidase subunit IV family protein [Pirellulales bacterium]|nr:cytochrome C oxidase subunit IV family protein [Pirellulales bacterium]MBX3432902.1 cytochrome C oxidase subunit IV family protein [Pirellulales bacterium]